LGEFSLRCGRTRRSRPSTEGTAPSPIHKRSHREGRPPHPCFKNYLGWLFVPCKGGFLDVSPPRPSPSGPENDGPTSPPVRPGTPVRRSPSEEPRRKNLPERHGWRPGS